MSGLIQTERIFYYEGFQSVAARYIFCTCLPEIEFRLASEGAIAATMLNERAATRRLLSDYFVRPLDQ